MKQINKKILSAFITLTLTIGSVNFAFADSDTISSELNQIKPIVNSLLEGMSYEKDLYDLQNVNFDNLYLGEKIPSYIDSNNQPKELKISYYPIMEGDEIVAIATVTYDNSGNPSVQIGKRFANELQEFTHDEDTSDSVALVFDKSGENLYVSDNEENYLVLDHFTLEDSERKSDLNINDVDPQKQFKDFDHESMEFTEIEPVKELDIQDLDTQSNLTNNQLLSVQRAGTISDNLTFSSKASSTDTKYLSVSKVLQNGLNICWAASVACVGNYKTGDSYTAKQVAKKMNISYDTGAGIKDSKKALSSIYDIAADRNSSAPSVSTIISEIQADNPIWTGFGASSGLGHSVVFRGYSSSSRNFSISYMDPNEGFLTMSVAQDGVYQFAYGATVFTCECYLDI